MDPERERIYDDLRGQVAGDVRCDDRFVRLYATDASIYQIDPLGVVCPRHVDDVVATVRYAAENNLSIHARGAGTGLAGESLGRGLILDFSRYMRRILAVDLDTVRVQPGVVLANLNAELVKTSRTFGPDPANSSVTTMGSVIALDASGSRWLRYGSARRQVRKLQVVLADGSVRELPSAPCEPSADPLHSAVDELLSPRRELIEQHQPPGKPSRGGYRLGGLTDNGELNLARLIAGSQGTLALITEAELAVEPLPAHVGVALLLFDRLESAARAVEELLTLPIAACDLMDRRHLGLARESDDRYDLLIPSIAEAALVVECQAESAAELREQLSAIAQQVRGEKRLAIDARHTLDPEEREFYWRLATRVVPRLHRLKGSTRPLPFVEDVLVPPAALPNFFMKLQNVLKRHEVTASVYGHAAHGRLHVRPFLDLLSPHDVAKMQPLAEQFYDEVLQAGGWIGGELGDGISRTPYLARQSGPLYDLFRALKTIFDPTNLLNPGKIVAENPAPLTAFRRALGERPTNGDAELPAPPPVISLQLNWAPEGIARMADACNGCGACRAQTPGGRMCPMFRFLPREEASPRAKANLMRAVLSGTLDPESLATDEFKSLADHCVNCQQCRAECPAGVDISKLMVEAKAAYVAQNGLQPSDWLMTRLDLAGAIGGLISPVANWALANRQSRWLLEKLLGIAHGRKLPRVARRSFLRRASRRRLNRAHRGAGPKVLYFVDTFANYFDPELAEAFVAVLEHNGVSVYAPGAQVQSGMAPMTLGAIDVARRFAARNVSVLAEAVRQGYEIVATEPAAALCLTREYPQLLDDDETQLVAANTSEACTYLWRMHRQGKLQLDFKPMAATLGYHAPCMLKALDVGSPGENLLRLIPGLFVDSRESGCSGMAGTFGLKRENYRNSLRAGWELISRMRAPAIQAGTTECSACRMQMEQGTTKPTLHPIKILAMAYGLMPQLRQLLTARGHDLLLS